MRTCIQTELHGQFVANRDQLTNPIWLEEFIRPHCRLKSAGLRGSNLRLIQVASEWSALLRFMANNRVLSYLEIGTSSGGSFYCADSYLRAVFSDYKYSLGVDIRNKMRWLHNYQAQFPSARFIQASSKSIKLDESFDFAFIDARHVEKWVLKDFEKVRSHCRFVAFHDIVRGSVPLAWAKIKANRKHWEFIDRSVVTEAQCGIGIIEV